jgi:hypothetical protein
MRPISAFVCDFVCASALDFTLAYTYTYTYAYAYAYACAINWYYDTNTVAEENL